MSSRACRRSGSALPSHPSPRSSAQSSRGRDRSKKRLLLGGRRVRHDAHLLGSAVAGERPQIAPHREVDVRVATGRSKGRQHWPGDLPPSSEPLELPRPHPNPEWTPVLVSSLIRRAGRCEMQPTSPTATSVLSALTQERILDLARVFGVRLRATASITKRQLAQTPTHPRVRS